MNTLLLVGSLLLSAFAGSPDQAAAPPTPDCIAQRDHGIAACNAEADACAAKVNAGASQCTARNSGADSSVCTDTQAQGGDACREWKKDCYDRAGKIERCAGTTKTDPDQ